jgi:membrane protein DedA with SNARE-associated domain
MQEFLVNNLESAVAYAPAWGFALILLLMTVESSFIPFPSEVVMIPAGFLAVRGELTCGVPWLDMLIALAVALLGSLAGACINYWLASKLGRPLLYRYGKYFLLSPHTLQRSEEIFRKYGEMTTFVCRMLPAIRQLISLPAGLCQMNFRRFSFFTLLGAGIWCLILLLVGWYLGKAAGDISYPELVARGSDLIRQHYALLLGSLAILVAAYLTVQHFVMKSGTSTENHCSQSR